MKSVLGKRIFELGEKDTVTIALIINISIEHSRKKEKNLKIIFS